MPACLPLRLLLAVAAVALLARCGDDAPPAVPPSECSVDDDCTSGTSAASCRDGHCAAPSCPPGSAYVPGGSFARGCQSSDPDCDPSAQPLATVTLSRGYCLALVELAVADYRACLQSGRCPPPAPPETLDSLRCSPDHATFTVAVQGNEGLPMNCLLWPEADSACRARGGRLPTEAEWERAARGRDSRPFPWGRVAAVSCDSGANFAGLDCLGAPWPAMSSGRSGGMLRGPYGHLDLGGNLSEWVADYFASDGYASCQGGCSDPLGPPTGTLRARRGGSFRSALSELRSYGREFQPPLGPRADLIGTRCAFDLVP